MTSQTIPLPALARALRDMTQGDVPGYRRLHGLVCDGVLPSETRNGRIYIRQSDLPGIIAALGLEIAA